jgi:hypothetical protein
LFELHFSEVSRPAIRDRPDHVEELVVDAIGARSGGDWLDWRREFVRAESDVSHRLGKVRFTQESKCERHIRLLAPLAFTAPSIVQSIIDGTAPVNLTVTELAKSSVHSWRRQQHLLKVSRKR